MSQELPTRIGFDEALALIRAFAPRLSSERVPLARARGAVLAADLVAELALPGFDNSAMDGFALRADEANAAAESG